MKKSFTLLELIVVLIILGIVAGIAIEILLRVYQNYVVTKATNKLVYETDLVINEIAAKLQNRIPNSVIASNNEKSFISLQAINPDNENNYQNIEWLEKDIYSKRGEWSEELKKVIPGWSGFVDLKKTLVNGNDDYDIVIPYSKMSIVQDIDGNWTQEWGIEGYDNVFENELEVLVFSGSDGRGAFSDIYNSYGWYHKNANEIFKIKKILVDDINNTTIEVKSITDSNTTTVYEGFYLVNTAMAIVPVKDFKFNDYNLTFYQNYFPWKGQIFSDGNKSILATHVTNFRFKEENGVLLIYLCIQDPNVKIDSSHYLNICKEKAIF